MRLISDHSYSGPEVLKLLVLNYTHPVISVNRALRQLQSVGGGAERPAQGSSCECLISRDIQHRTESDDSSSLLHLAHLTPFVNIVVCDLVQI